MKRMLIAAALGASMLLPGACTSPDPAARNAGVQEKPLSGDTGVDFKTAENYFVKNTVSGNLPAKITTQEEFDRYFGEATTMGESGKPTSIDFSEQYVIVAGHEPTQVKTEIIPVSLENQGSELVFRYLVHQGQEAGYTMRPFIILIVSSEQQGNLILQPIEEIEEN